MRCLHWFREDLRIADNTALHHAARVADNGVVAVYIISPQDWQAHDTAACRVDFILRNLEILSAELKRLHIPLLIRHAKTAEEISQLLLKLAHETAVDALYFNQQYEIDEARRDQKVEALLRANKIPVFSYTDQVILAPGEVLTATGNYYTVFTPFKNNWLKQISKQKYTVLASPKIQAEVTIASDAVPTQVAGFASAIPAALWPAGEKHAQQRLQKFISDKVQDYAKQRDFPNIDGTSKLSPYLSAGVISPRQCLHAAMEANHGHVTSGKSGILTWINELIWREFYKHILYAFPRVSMSRAFKRETEVLWQHNNAEFFAAWQAGQTGYPLVDAAMRQLKQIGWMHNRLRMIVAMFLTKNLWIDWRWGEKYFMQNLIDGDLAANNGGWQWAASTGTDAVPYFRIFNPITQSQKFDPQGLFIRHYCPELAGLDDKAIHEPYACKNLFSQALIYPHPIVDLKKTRAHALKAFKTLTDH